MSYMALATITAVPLAVLVTAAAYLLIQPASRREWATWLTVVALAAAWLVIVLALAADADAVDTGLREAARVLEEIVGGRR